MISLSMLCNSYAQLRPDGEQLVILSVVDLPFQLSARNQANANSNVLCQVFCDNDQIY